MIIFSGGLNKKEPKEAFYSVDTVPYIYLACMVCMCVSFTGWILKDEATQVSKSW